MAISMTFYGDLAEAGDYFANRLHEVAWSGADVADRPKALISATQIIDTLNYKGSKAAVYAFLVSQPNTSTLTAAQILSLQAGVDPNTLTPAQKLALQAGIMAADASQELEFPRGTDTIVPEAIRRACYEIAYSLLDGKDPEQELENLDVASQGYASVRTTYSRTHIPVEHTVNGVPSAQAWRLLRPFLRDDDSIKISRAS